MERNKTSSCDIRGSIYHRTAAWNLLLIKPSSVLLIPAHRHKNHAHEIIWKLNIILHTTHTQLEACKIWITNSCWSQATGVVKEFPTKGRALLAGTKRFGSRIFLLLLLRALMVWEANKIVKTALMRFDGYVDIWLNKYVWNLWMCKS